MGLDADDEFFGLPCPEDDDDDEGVEQRRVLSAHQLHRTGNRQRWWLLLWEDVCRLRARYQLPVRSRWWEDSIQVEALAALAAWVSRYDSGDWEDPPGKLTLLFEIERVETLLRDGNDPFDPRRDRPGFERHLELFGGEPPPW